MHVCATVSRRRRFGFPAIRKVYHSRARISRMADIRLGTSAFTAAGWGGTFYPTGMKPADYLNYYASKFDTVEVDSTVASPGMATPLGLAGRVTAVTAMRDFDHGTCRCIRVFKDH
jgi:hypothetical protein